jgi:hypothetical protein
MQHHSNSNETIDDVFPGKFFRASDLPNAGIVGTIDTVDIEDFGDQRKPVVTFIEHKQKFVANKTNARIIAATAGKSFAEWSGHRLRMRPDKTTYQGRLTDCIRVVVLDDDELDDIGAGPGAGGAR